MNKNLRLANDFYCRKAILDETPAVGEYLNRWRIIAAWVDKNSYIKGYQLKCETCGNLLQYVSVFDARAKQVRYCKHVSPDGAPQN